MGTHTTYYEDETGARVTDTCVTIGDNAYSTASITSVTTAVENPRRGKLIGVAVLALAFVFFGWASGSYNWFVCGIILLILSGSAYYAVKPTWRLHLAKRRVKLRLFNRPIRRRFRVSLKPSVKPSLIEPR